MQRLLDLYLSGDFHNGTLIDKQSELEKAIAELEHERSALLASPRSQSLSDDQEQTLIDFAHRLSGGLANADANLKTRRGIIEALGAEAILSQEEGAKTVRIKCILGEDYYVISPILFEDLSVRTL